MTLTTETAPEPLGAPGSAPWWDAHAERLERRRPRAGGLTVEQIVDAALSLADADGYESLTVRNLATKLGTSSATLYRHVASVDELLVLVVDRVLGEIRLPDPSADARDRIAALSTELRRVLLDHPGVLPALRAAPLLGPNGRRSAEAGLANLLAMDIPQDVAVAGYLALIDFVLGSVYFDTAGALHRHGRPTDVERHLVTPLDRDSAFAISRVTLDSATSDAVFCVALDVFLDGLAARRTAARGARPA
jgi:AcrR family transcriptional regulator